MKKIIFSSAFIACLLGACKEREFLNPGSASETQVVNSVNGLITLANGLQYRYSTSGAGVVYCSISANGLTTKELTVLNVGNTDLELINKGAGNLQGNNSVISNIWAQSHLTKTSADLILNNIEIVADPGIKSGLIAYASIFKALSLGTLAQFWQSAPIGTGENMTFNSREELIKEAIALLEGAAVAVSTNPPAAGFTSRVVNSIDMPNTIQALLARYYMMSSDYDKALAAASKVNLESKSSFKFDDVTQNPIFFSSFGNRNVTEPVDMDLGLTGELKPEAGDQRIKFYIQTATPSRNLGTGFFTSNSAPIPVYLPGEMLLIIAEANVRKDNFPAAVTALNQVRTKTTDAWGIGASLEPYAGALTANALMTEIYKNRCIELFLSGLKLEDSRRFARPATERNRDWYPFPDNERQNNRNTPADPTN